MREASTAQPSQPDSAGDPADVLTQQIPTIDRIVAGLAHRYTLSADEEADLRSLAFEKLIEDNYRVMTRFEGRSSWGSYLAVVIANLFRDYRVREWGRWRPSAAAQRAGVVGIRLDELLNRDRHTLQQAIQALRSEREVAMSDRDLAALAVSFPERTRPRIRQIDHQAEDSPARDVSDETLERSRRSRAEQRVLREMNEALETLDTEDRAILRLRFWEGSTVADIGRALGLDQRSLYRRVRRLLADLRSRLEAQGVSLAEIRDLLGDLE